MVISNGNKKKGYNLRWHTRDSKVLFLHNTMIHVVMNQPQLDMEIEANERYLELQQQIKDTPEKEIIGQTQIVIFVVTTALLLVVWLAGKYL